MVNQMPKLTITDAQTDMRKAYYGGGFGVLASGSAWLVSGIVATFNDLWPAVIALYLCGMFIHPVGVLLSKFAGRPGKHEKDNRLGRLAIESTFMMFVGLFIALAVAMRIPNWFFSIMLLVIGGRYFIFETIYGDRIYWIFRGLLNSPFNNKHARNNIPSKYSPHFLLNQAYHFFDRVQRADTII
jgi:hypothetical protein